MLRRNVNQQFIASSPVNSSSLTLLPMSSYDLTTDCSQCISTSCLLDFQLAICSYSRKQ